MELSRSELSKSKKKINKLTRCSFKYFLKRSFLELSGGSELQYSWYLDLIVEHLSAVESGDLKRLIINIPPRHLKSMTVNVFWSAWLLGRDPSLKIISTSYSHNLSVKHAQDTRYLLNTSLYKKLFPQTKIVRGADTKSKFITTNHGFRLATSIGGTLTGEGG